LAETNSTASDFAKGESELASGSNVEHGGAGFALNFFFFGGGLSMQMFCLCGC